MSNVRHYYTYLKTVLLPLLLLDYPATLGDTHRYYDRPFPKCLPPTSVKSRRYKSYV